MPKIPNTTRINGVFYVRKRVPADVEKILKTREIRISLRTSDYKAAAKAVPFELAKLESRFEDARKKQRKIEILETPAEPPMTEITDGGAMQLVASWFIGLEKDSEQWWEGEGHGLPQASIQEIEDAVGTDMTALRGGNENVPLDDGSSALDRFLEERGLNVQKQSQAYKRLRGLFHRGLVEHSLRVLDRLERQAPAPRDSLFRELFAHSEPPKRETPKTLGDLLSAFTAHHKKISSPATQITYQIPIRVLKEFFGEKKRLSEIEPSHMARFFDLLEQTPKNAEQRYPGLKLQEAVARANKDGDSQRLAPKTLANYYRNVTAIFNFGVEFKMVEQNPSKSRIFRRRLDAIGDEGEPKALFAVTELNKLFRAPLYTGSVDDEHGYAKKGEKVVKRGRYWGPLLALFHGFRMNEICQLHSADIKQVGDTWIIWIRKTGDDGKKTEKRVKSRQSKRQVPIHQMLIRMGFIDFVRKRQADTNSPRLFPELEAGKKGYFSDAYSKWFARFSESIIPGTKATFHSFRHMWRTALRHADVNVADSEQLGGWGNGEKSSQENYDHGQLLVKLKKQIDKVQFPDLDLSHLYVLPQARVRRLHPSPTGM